MQQRLELIRELQIEDKARYSDRIKVILLLDKGWTYKKIAEALFLDEGTIANYRQRYNEGGLERLVNDYYSGKRSFLSEDQLIELQSHLTDNLYQRTIDICNYVKGKYGVSYSVSGMTFILHLMGFTYKKAKGTPAKADKKSQEDFVKEYENLKDNHAKIYFADSTHPQHNPVLSYGWIRKGEEKEVLTNTGRSRININGAVDIESKDIIIRSTDTVDAIAVVSLLKAIRSKNGDDATIAVVMDNARYNRSLLVLKVAKELKIRLIYLPPYSPNLNPIERLWKFFKKNVLYNKYYESFELFSKSCSEFFRCSLRKFKTELASLLSDNFHIVGT